MLKVNLYDKIKISKMIAINNLKLKVLNFQKLD
jgi:hypothetical protein